MPSIMSELLHVCGTGIEQGPQDPLQWPAYWPLAHDPSVEEMIGSPALVPTTILFMAGHLSVICWFINALRLISSANSGHIGNKFNVSSQCQWNKNTRYVGDDVNKKDERKYHTYARKITYAIVIQVTPFWITLCHKYTNAATPIQQCVIIFKLWRRYEVRALGIARRHVRMHNAINNGHLEWVMNGWQLSRLWLYTIYAVANFDFICQAQTYDCKCSVKCLHSFFIVLLCLYSRYSDDVSNDIIDDCINASEIAIAQVICKPQQILLKCTRIACLILCIFRPWFQKHSTSIFMTYCCSCFYIKVLCIAEQTNSVATGISMA